MTARGKLRDTDECEFHSCRAKWTTKGEERRSKKTLSVAAVSFPFARHYSSEQKKPTSLGFRFLRIDLRLTIRRDDDRAAAAAAAATARGGGLSKTSSQLSLNVQQKESIELQKSRGERADGRTDGGELGVPPHGLPSLSLPFPDGREIF